MLFALSRALFMLHTRHFADQRKSQSTVAWKQACVHIFKDVNFPSDCSGAFSSFWLFFKKILTSLQLLILDYCFIQQPSIDVCRHTVRCFDAVYSGCNSRNVTVGHQHFEGSCFLLFGLCFSEKFVSIDVTSLIL